MKDSLVAIVFLVSAFVASAQTTTESPYSFYGLGDINSRAFANQRAMGGSQMAGISEVYINTANPATFGKIGYTTFQVDLNMDYRTIESSTVKQNTSNMYFNNLAIAFPLGKKGGLAASIRQYTKIGYNIQVAQEDPFLGAFDLQYDGQGGINEFQLGAGYSIIDDTTTTISVGANFLYYFGFAETNRRSGNFVDITDALSTNQQGRTSLNDISFDVGLYADRQLTKNFKIGLGAAYTPTREVKAKNHTLAYTYRSVLGDPIPKDTSVNFDGTGKIVMPSQLNLGVGFYLGSTWTILLDYKVQKWSDLEIFGQNDGLKDRSDFSIGIQSQPNAEPLAKYFQNIQYRLGARFTQSRLVIRSQEVSEYAFSGGLGLPILRTKSKSSLNIGIEFGQRGSKENGLIKENFTNLYLGVSFNPHKFDSWFKKSKYN